MLRAARPQHEYAGSTHCYVACCGSACFGRTYGYVACLSLGVAILLRGFLCRCVAADVLQQLHAAEVLQEQGRHKRWVAAVAAWRTLRSQYAVRCFCKHITDNLAEPPARLELFESLRTRQQKAHTTLARLCQRLTHLVPPHMSTQAVQGWVNQAMEWCDGWQQQLEGCLQQLRQQEEELERQVRVMGPVVPWRSLAAGDIWQVRSLQPCWIVGIWPTAGCMAHCCACNAVDPVAGHS